MAAVQIYMDGNCKVTFCDDYCVKTKEDIEKLSANISEIYLKSRISRFLEKQEIKDKGQ